MSAKKPKYTDPMIGDTTTDEFWSSKALQKHGHLPLDRDTMRSHFIHTSKYQPKKAFSYLQPMPEPLPTLREYQQSLRAARFRKLEQSEKPPELKTRISEPLPPIFATPSEKRNPYSDSPEHSAKKMHLQGEKHKPLRRVTKSKKELKKDFSIFGLSDISQVISVVRRHKSYNIDFLYLTPVYPKTSPHHNFYRLKVARYSSIDKSNYFTISSRGVIWFCSGAEAEFFELKEFEQDYLKFKKLRAFQFFGQFQMWKPFKQWYSNIRWMKIQRSTTFLKENLFIANPLLCTAILAIRDMCHKIAEMTLCSIQKGKIYNLAEFQTLQKEQVSTINKHLQQFHELVRDIVFNACSSSMLKEGFIPDNRKTDPNPTNPEAPNPSVPNLKPKKNKRLVCNRLSCFIHFIDYIIVSVLRQLVIDSVLKLLNYLVELLNIMPCVASSSLKRKKSVVVCTGPDFFLNETDEDAETEESRPLFIVDLILKYDRFIFSPDYKSFTDGITQIMHNYQETVLAVPNLLPDEHYNSFTQPIVYNCQLEKICGNGPNLFIIFEEDGSLQSLLKSIQDAFVTTFDNANTYSFMLSKMLTFYQENESVDIQSLKGDEHDVNFFESYLIIFDDQLSTLNGVQAKLPIGFLLINSTNVKDLVTTSTQKLRQIVSDLLLEKAYGEVNHLIDIFTNASFKLQSKPSDIVEVVKYLTFLDEMKEQVQPLVDDCDVVNDMYQLIAKFELNLPPDYQAVYQILGPTMDTCRNTIDEAVADRDNCLKKFCEFALTNINDLKKDVNEIRQEAMNPKIMDIGSDKVKIKELLKTLCTQVNELKENATSYQNYQIQFQVEVSQFDELEELLSELSLKQQLWLAMDEWQDLTESWSTTPFESLNHEELTKSTNKYMNICNTMQSVLPPNNIVPVLKERVEEMKEKLPMIQQLHNPALRTRHWEQIQKVLNLVISPEEHFTIQTLADLDAFSHLDEVQEISGQASSEHSLELILKKVEDSWKKTDFIILPFKDQEDVFILGGTDDVQQILDDSIINIATIASSRYVAPIKVRVDEWQARLELFSKTLEMWLQCQKMWLYLESIFTAPDINRQLPNEGKLFRHVDKSYKTIMRQAYARPRALRACLQPGLLETFQNNNALLDSIHKCLETYLELKRLSFPRFYFLSNDELLEILSQTRDPLAVQPHLRKCFDAIQFLEFEGVDVFHKEPAESDGQQHIDAIKTILAMISPEGETVSLGKDLKTRGSVEDWLVKVEDAMFNSIRLLLKKSIADFAIMPYEEWLMSYPHQVILTISLIVWCSDIHAILESDEDRLELMRDFEEKNFTGLTRMAALVRGNLTKLGRATLCALITISVNARDIVTDLVKSKVDDVLSFDWQKQQRYYWDVSMDTCVVNMSNAVYIYGYEYLGASPRLVITPLTNRCYLCLMGALQLDLGGAPAGPAGTGKTETTKDLAKSLAKHCVVFNCSDGIDYKMMGRFFSGLAQTGAWCCFDEFNRIYIEVLSVIAQQLITIRNAKVARVTRFMFEGREIKLRRDCSAFITMNPGYAGRTELPDNLKALFRPISMMVPDYCLIAEVILYSEGFESSKMLAQKMTQMYKLCSEQLSQQDHYDFGMRALKSVLVMAGSLKQANPDKNEDAVLIRALRDSNLPKFLKQDVVLFQAILQDLFPGIVIPEHDYGLLQTEIISVMEAQKLQPLAPLVKKVIQLYETVIVRHGVMLVGPTGGGKTTCYNILATTLTNLSEKDTSNSFYKPVHCHILNPKSIDMEELYGGINKLTLEWHDGLMAIIVRIAVADTKEDHQWVICDGPVDALWIENLNTVLDDNKMLCLANSERIKLTPFIRMVFEVENLAVASPATVSRCGMVFVDPEELDWSAYVKTWITKFEMKIKPETKDFLLDLFDTYVNAGLKYVQKSCVQSINQVEISKVTTLCKLLESLIFSTEEKNVNFAMNPAHLHPIICTTFMFCFVWAIGGNIIEANWDTFDNFVRNLFDKNPNAKAPNSGDLWSVFMDFSTGRLESWKMIMPHFVYNKDIPFMEMFVPSVDTVRFGYLLQKLLDVRKSVLYTGSTGVGKSVIANKILIGIADWKKYVPIFVNFSAQTSSIRTQEMIESKLEKKKKNCFGAPAGKRLIIFIDDMNMPKLDTYGSQPPIELLRQYQDFQGFYQREMFTWMEIKDVTLCAACCPPGGGRNPVTPRFIRHFSMFSIPSPDEFSLKLMFSAILNGFMADFHQAVRQSVEAIVGAAVEIYGSMKTDLLPTPAKSHYLFNLRDLSKCVQGMLQANVRIVQSSNDVFRLFCHEAQRVFHDRLICQEDKIYFYQMLSDIAQKHFHETIPPDELKNNPIIFGDFLQVEVPTSDRVYKEITNMQKLQNVLGQYLEGFNLQASREVTLVFFTDVLQHISRVVRMIRQERGNALLVGVGGTGKQSVTRLAAFICGYQCFSIELRRGYDYTAFHDDLKTLYEMAGVRNDNTVFLFTDTQIVMEEFLEDINNILNSGEVPNLLESEDFEKLIAACRPDAKKAGINEQSRDQILAYAINRIRNNLHIVLCMSPVGSSFRSRCRMFPSLVNCCIIDWFTEWPEEALLSVASFYLKGVVRFSDEMKVKLGQMCVIMHTSVFDMAETFYQTLKRRFYITPTSYLELITLYLSMLETKDKELKQAHSRIQNGVNKIEETNVKVDSMKLELVAMEPELKQKSTDTMELLEKLAVDQSSADEVKEKVMREEAKAKAKANETESIAADAQKDLDEALPALEGAIKALDALDKSDIAEIRVFASPPELVMTVMEAVCILMHVKADWPSAKSLLADPNFLKHLRDYDKNHIPESLLRKLKPYIDNPKFFPEIVENVSKACKSLCMWVRAIDLYAHVFRTVEPKRERLAKAKEELEVVMTALKKQQQELADVEATINKLKKTYNDSVHERERLERKITQTAVRLKRSTKLTTALADKYQRWCDIIVELEKQEGNVSGDVLVAAACVTYCGAFTNVYRQELIQLWIDNCNMLEIPISDNLSLVNVLSSPYEIQQWNAVGLPKDNVSIDNAIMVTQGHRWPLMIDPQEQANMWICRLEEENGLVVIKQTDKNFLRTLENCIRVGRPVLLEDVGETIEPSLEPLLTKNISMKSGRPLIRLGDADIDYDRHFKFYMTTKLANPLYMPEVCVKVTMVNFTVTKSGLEDQILSDVVRLERPELEEQRNQLIIDINNAKNTLKSIEDRILQLLYESEGNILDKEELVNTLDEAKATSDTINVQLLNTEQTEMKISAAREKYRAVATRGSILYFVVADMSLVDPMYQFSLKYFKQLLNMTIENSEQSNILEKRLAILLKEITEFIYKNVSRGLFEKHKLLFSFMLCVEILKNEKKITPEEWNFFLRGGASIDEVYPPIPEVAGLTAHIWNSACDLSRCLSDFFGLKEDIAIENIRVQLGSVVVNALAPSADTPTTDTPTKSEAGSPEESVTMSEKWDYSLTSFQKLITIKAFEEEKTILAITDFISENLGKIFVESPPVGLNTLYEDISRIIPLIFILSSGSDPMGALLKFASTKDYTHRVQAISLGQGQGPIAEGLIKTATQNGDWVFLQNCHLAQSWMPSLETLTRSLIDKPEKVNQDFRLYLSSMPAKHFPISVLQNSVKVTNEPPKGLRANMARAFANLTSSFFETNVLQTDWCKMVYGLCFFHAIIQERKKFGPLGWNIQYDFAESDRECALLNLQMFCTQTIPWDALIYITSEITYGGRITDNWDQRCLRTVLKAFFHPDSLDPDYAYSPSGIYYAPDANTLEDYLEYINDLPLNDEPEIFGMHENVNIVFQKQETSNLVRTILSIQPRISSEGGLKSNDEIVTDLATNIQERLMDKLDMDQCRKSLFQLDDKGRVNSLTTVLSQEVDRFNKLLRVIKDSVYQLKQAIKGNVVMSLELEMMYQSFLDNQVPLMWANAAYPSMMAMGSWVQDLIARCAFLDRWIHKGQPNSFWLPGFFFPQGFLTGTLQNHARKYNLPIDHLTFLFTVRPYYYQSDGSSPEQEEDNNSLTDGVLVYGLYMDGFCFDLERMSVADCLPGQMNPLLPVMHMLPEMDLERDEDDYTSPLYKTPMRAGTLSTTGHSTNFVVPVELPSDMPADYWIARGSALLCTLATLSVS